MGMKRNVRPGMKWKWLGAAACVAGLVAALAGCGSQAVRPGAETELPKILVGSDNYPPYNYEDASGQPTGIDVELATEAFRRMGYRAVFVYIDWEEKTELVESGQIDCIWGSFSIDGREDDYRWTEPYMYSRQVVAVRQDSDIQTLAELEGKRVAVQSTTKPEQLFLHQEESPVPKVAEVFSFPSRELIYPFLSKGYADAVAAHETSILQYMMDYDLEYRILDEPLLTVGLGVAFAREDDRGLEQELSTIFEEMRRDGTMETIIGKYLENPQKFMEADSHEQ